MPGILAEISLPLDNFCAVIEVDDAAALHSINGKSMRVLTLLYMAQCKFQLNILTVQQVLTLFSQLLLTLL